MKKVLFIGAMLLCGMMFSANLANAQNNVTKVERYCGAKDYPDTKAALHGYGTGDSKTLEGARLRAELSAQKYLSKRIQSYVESYIKTLGEDIGIDNDGEVNTLVIEIGKSISQQVISDVSTVCEESVTYTNEAGGMIYRCFMTLELDRTVLAKAAYEKIKQRRILKARETFSDFDKGMKSF